MLHALSGYILPPTDDPAPTLLKFAANQTGINAGEWNNYARREQTRREHLVELQTSFGFQPFTVSHYRHAVRGLDEVASQTDKGIVLAQTLVEDLRRKKVLFPSVNVIERALQRRSRAPLGESTAILLNRLNDLA